MLLSLLFRDSHFVNQRRVAIDIHDYSNSIRLSKVKREHQNRYNLIAFIELIGEPWVRKSLEVVIGFFFLTYL